MVSSTNELTAIHELTGRFFSIFDNRNGKIPDWDELWNCCIPECTIIRTSQEDLQCYSLVTFMEPRKLLLTDGRLTDFHEYEISHETIISGHIAQRFSRYAKSGILEGKLYGGKGSKCLQFVKTAGGWVICSVVWEDDPVIE